jgi:hypothetical protein
MITRRDFLAAGVTAASFSLSAQADDQMASNTRRTKAADPALARTHAALFDMWFPIRELAIPKPIRPKIVRIAAEVRKSMLAAFLNSTLVTLLEGMTRPEALPFYECLVGSSNPAVAAFLAVPGGFGAMHPKYRIPLFSFLFEGSCTAESVQVAMILREAYLSGIWDFPLAVPLTGINPPKIFVDNIPDYVKSHAPTIPDPRIYFDPESKTIRHIDGPIQYLVIGSGPGGATVAHHLQRSGKRVVLIEKGPFVVWGSMTTRSYPSLMYENDQAATFDNSVVVRSGVTLGGGTTVNIDLAFSPLESTVLSRIDHWIQQGWIDKDLYTLDRIASAYQWVKEVIGTRQISPDEVNPDNQVLWDGAQAYGVDPSLYHLNRFGPGASPSPVDDKLDAARQLLLDAIQEPQNPLSVIPDASVDSILFKPNADHTNLRAAGAILTMKSPWVDFGNTVVDPCKLAIPPGTEVSIAAENVILAAGTIGTTRILLNTAKTTPLIANPRIGKGQIMHPSFPLIGLFDKPIDMLEGLDSATYVDSFGVEPGFIFETINGLPAYGALLVPGTGKQIYEQIVRYNNYAGFGVMLVDTPSDSNSISLDEQGNVRIQYELSESDKARFRIGVAIAIRMMFLAGATQVIIPTNENVLGLPDFDPMRGVYLTRIEEADLVEQNLQFTPNRTLITSAHLQAANKMGASLQTSVVSTRNRLWNVKGQEIPNLYVMDSSIFPTSVGANPMQSIYTFARILSEQLIRDTTASRSAA